MAQLTWDAVGQRIFETGVDRGVLYIPNAQGVLNNGVAWNGLTTVTESRSGAEATPQYADNIKYLNLISAEEFAATIEAFTYPDEFAQFDGTATPTPGVQVGQQNRKTFGLAFRTRVGNDLVGTDFGYKLHLIWGCLAAPTEKAYATINDSPEAITFSWELSTSVQDAGPNLKPTAQITIDSTKVPAAKLAQLEALLYGTGGVDPQLPTPAAVIAIFTAGNIAIPVVTAPTYVLATKTITIPTTAGVVYTVDSKPVAAGPLVITKATTVKAIAAPGYTFPDPTDDDWTFQIV